MHLDASCFLFVLRCRCVGWKSTWAHLGIWVVLSVAVCKRIICLSCKSYIAHQIWDEANGLKGLQPHLLGSDLYTDASALRTSAHSSIHIIRALQPMTLQAASYVSLSLAGNAADGLCRLSGCQPEEHRMSQLHSLVHQEMFAWRGARLNGQPHQLPG